MKAKQTTNNKRGASDKVNADNLNRHKPENSCIGLLQIVLGCCIALVFLNLNYLDKKTNFEDAATFGVATTSVMASVDGHRIHCSDSRDAAECIMGAKVRGAERTVIWMGNSQVHAVNQLRTGETNSAPILFGRLKAMDFDLVTFSQPNANLQEHLVLFEYLRQQLPIRGLILAAVFDDTREDGLRKEIGHFLDDTSTRTALSETAIGSKILRGHKMASTNTDSDTAGIAHTLQEHVEQFLNTWLQKHSALWGARPEIRGQIMLGLYVWRNSILGIKPTSKRKVIRGRYQDNLAALEAILASAASRNIKVLLYIAPLRSDVEIPYVDAEYRVFKADVEKLTHQYGATWANLENLVPAELWGSKEATSAEGGQELDFMHFQAGGHQLLAARLAELVTDAWAKQEVQP